MTQNPEQTTPSTTWQEDFNQTFTEWAESNGMSVTAYLPYQVAIRQFIQTQIDKAKAETRAEVFDEVIQFIKPISKSYSREHDKTSYEVNRCLVDLMRCIEELKKIKPKHL